MYLDDILSKATLVSELDTNSDLVVLLPTGSADWCNKNLVVQKSDLDAVWLEHHAKEPDMEVIVNTLLSNPVRDFYRILSDNPAVKDTFLQLDSYVENNSKVEDLEVSVAEDEGIYSLSDLAVEQNLESEPNDGSFVNSEKSEVDDAANECRNGEHLNTTHIPSIEELLAEAEMGCTNPVEVELDEHAISPLAENCFNPAGEDSVDNITKLEDLCCEQQSDGNCDLFGIFGELIPDETNMPGFSENEQEEMSAEVHEPEPELEPEPEPEPETELEEDSRFDDLQRYRNFVFLKGAIPEVSEVEAWAKSCTSIYKRMENDFEIVLRDNKITDIMYSSSITPSTFVAIMREDVFDIAEVIDVTDAFVNSLDTATFMSMLRVCYLQSLKHCIAYDEDTAAQLARYFVKLIYEE